MGQRLWNTLKVSAISVMISIPIGVGIGTVLAYFQKNTLSSVVLNITTVIFTIPSIAMLGFMMPLFGLGLLPSVIALVLYAQIPILRNTYVGLSNVSQNVILAAEGIGVGRKDILFKIRFPVTLPIIMAGIRNSVVLTIGIATIASLIGAGGLGDLILRGIQQSNTDLILAGTLPVIILAISADVGLKSIEDRLTSRGIK
ncbi:MAG: ABC transporter permease [Rhabdochlamydiaceae bacterium]